MRDVKDMNADRDFQISVATDFHKVEGLVESLTRWGATGWAWMPDEPTVALEIEVCLGGNVIGRCVADQMRSDLNKLGKRSGKCSFSVIFEAPITDDRLPTFHAMSPLGSFELAQTQWSAIDGYVDLLTRSSAMGWVWVPAKPNLALRVEAILNDTVIGATIANEMRSDIAASGRGTGRYGFTIRFDKAITDGKVPAFRVMDSDAATFLKCPESLEPFEGVVDGLTRWGATGWAWMPEAPEEKMRVEASLQGNTIAQSIADQLRPDLVSSGRGGGQCGFTLTFQNVLTTDELPTIRVIGSQGETILSGATWSVIDGSVDSLSRWGAIGWVWMPSDPDRELKVNAILRGELIGTSTANMMRQDIAGSGRGSGNYGFTLSFDQPITPEALPEFHVVGADEPAVLGNFAAFEEVLVPETSGTLREVIEASSQPEKATAFGLTVEGAVDRLTRWGATGWAWMPSAAAAAVEVEAVVNGRVIGKATANQLRPDLAEHGKGTGLYGYVLGFSEPVIGSQVPLLRVVGPEGPTILPCSITTLPELEVQTVSTPSPYREAQSDLPPSMPTVEGHIDVLTRWDAAGWAWIPSAPDQPVQIEAILDGKVIGRALADQPRPDLLKHGKGSGLYGFKVSFDEPITGSDSPQLRGLVAVGQVLAA